MPFILYNGVVTNPKPGPQSRVEAQQIIEHFSVIVKNELAPGQQKKVLDALEFTCILCEGYRPRGDGRERITHQVEVAQDILVKFGIKKPDVIIAGLLHDAVEDQPERTARLLGEDINEYPGVKHAALAGIRKKFGRPVAKMVEDLTNSEELLHGERLVRSSKTLEHAEGERIIHSRYHEHIVHMATGRKFSFLVKVADLARNAFRLDLIKDPETHAALARRYFHSMLFLEDHLESLRDKSNPLHASKKWLLTDLRVAMNRDYVELLMGK